jgi:hypothetical protein
MTPEELATEFTRMATEVARDMPYEKGRSIAYMTAAYMVRKHLCTPTPLHAEVEEARKQIERDGEKIERLENNIENLRLQVTEANADIARLKAVFRINMLRLGAGSHEEIDAAILAAAAPNPGLVTVRREDLLEVLWGLVNAGWRSKPSASFRQEETAVNAKLTAMEEAAR